MSESPIHPEKPATLETSPGWSDFTSDWFTPRIGQWNQYVKPLLPKEGPVHWLELGSYEGRSAIWTLENFCHHPESTLTCVDAFSRDYEKRFDANRAAHPDGEKIIKVKHDATKALIRYHGFHTPPQYDGIYIDADHSAQAVLAQGILALGLVKKGGAIIFDDYPLPLDPASNKPEDKPIRAGLDVFLDLWRHEFRVVFKQWQVILQRV